MAKKKEDILLEYEPDVYELLDLNIGKCRMAVAAPKTFREACQWTAFFNCAARIFTRDGAGFQLDELLLPYYENDVKNGILDDETAKFLIANFLLIDPHYYQVSGVDEFDKDKTNHLFSTTTDRFFCFLFYNER